MHWSLEFKPTPVMLTKLALLANSVVSDPDGVTYYDL
jgi:hypothetical protein